MGRASYSKILGVRQYAEVPSNLRKYNKKAKDSVQLDKDDNPFLNLGYHDINK